MRYPAFLQPEGTIGFVAPSFGCAIEPYKSGFQNAQNKWKEMGYHLWLGPNCYASDGIGISSTPSACGKELTEGYLTPDNDCLISCGGGELMCEILGDVDFAAIKEAAPKWYLGFSDNTNFTFLSATLCDTAAIYGPCAAAFGMEPWAPSIQDTWDLLTGKKLTFQGYDFWEKESLKTEEAPLTPYNLTEPNVITCYPNSALSMSGRLLGGCMDCLVNLLGTKYDRVTAFNERYQEDGVLWFLEACDLNVMSIRRAIWQMENAGWFDNCRGFLIGRPMHFEEPMMGLDRIHAVTDLLSHHNVPILLDADLGHLPPQLPLITGAMAKIDAANGKYTVSMELR